MSNSLKEHADELRQISNRLLQIHEEIPMGELAAEVYTASLMLRRVSIEYHIQVEGDVQEVFKQVDKL